MREGGRDDERTNVVTGVGRGAVDEVFEMRGIVDMTREVVDITIGVVVEMGEEIGIRVDRFGAEEREERTIDDDGSNVGDGGGDVSDGDVVEVYDDEKEEEELDIDVEEEEEEEDGELEDGEEVELVSDIELDELLEFIDDDDDDDADNDDEDEIELE